MTNKAPRNLTKDQIWEQLQEAKAILNTQGVAYNPQVEATERNNAEVVSTAVATTPEAVQSSILSIQTLVSSYLGQISNDVNAKIKLFQDVQAAINVKQSQLNDLYAIESELVDLTTVIKAKNLAQDELDKIKSEALNIKLALESELAQIREDAEKSLAREKAEWRYEFDRQAKIEKDKLEDELSDRSKKYSDQVAQAHAQLSEQKKQLDNHEEKLADRELELQARIEAFEKTQSDFEINTESKYKNQYAQSLQIEEAKFKSENGRLEDQVRSLTIQLTQKDALNADLQHKLDQAYKAIQEVAVKASTRVVVGSEGGNK